MQYVIYKSENTYNTYHKISKTQQIRSIYTCVTKSDFLELALERYLNFK